MSITEWSLNPHPSPCTCAHVDTLSAPALYAPTRGTPYPLCSRVFIEQTLDTPPPLYVHETGRRGGVSVFHHREQACPPSFPLSRPRPRWPGVCERRGRHRTGVRRSGHAGCRRPFHLPAAASPALTRLKTTAGEKRGKKDRRQLSGDACRMLLSVTSLMCAARK